MVSAQRTRHPTSSGQRPRWPGHSAWWSLDSASRSYRDAVFDVGSDPWPGEFLDDGIGAVSAVETSFAFVGDITHDGMVVSWCCALYELMDFG